ncbi:ABC transporter permease [Plantibacter sp. CFBP 13570]|uniref:ABC transporter permease n=1 Tax=Plantibacter sp. CFBP 13570 TaxID=2775272 RepID=UPI001FD05183|nr:ABC transporter permease [Plantibacter sp. CFBP 13570]
MPESSSVTPTTSSARAGLHPLARYLGIRLGLTVLLMFGVTLVTFTLTNLVPADPVQAALGEQAAADPTIVAQFRENAGLDKPLPVQYVTYVANLFQGDLGTSQQTRGAVADELGRAFPATAELALTAIVISIIIGVGLGMWAALRRKTITDQVIRVVSLIGISVPSFWLALVVYFVFFSQLHWFPGSGRLSPAAIPPPKVTGMYTIDALLAGQWSTFGDAIAHLILPASVLALYTIGLLTRFARSAILEVLDLDYVRAARAKGLPGHVVVTRYVLRGALVPIITVLGVAFGSLLSGTVLVEKVYSWHGLGEYAYSAATKLDLPAIMGVGLIVGFVYIGLNFLVDVLYGFIDPRVRVA